MVFSSCCRRPPRASPRRPSNCRSTPWSPATGALPRPIWRCRFKIVIKNESSGAIEFESLSLRKEKVLGPGAQSFVVIAPLKPGEFDFFDEFHPDTSRGRIRAK
ncbi:cupredoxin domain-containing protein [Thiobacillus sp.]|uniref:cupredoxin domain-containing protein n=1 Tax=Thiobacillus sp. TaxID=924 RepID=UPI00286DDD97|nr:cupredoxin domain-containing protein [Thiobacillus sp.]